MNNSVHVHALKHSSLPLTLSQKPRAERFVGGSVEDEFQVVYKRSCKGAEAGTCDVRGDV